MPVVDVREAFHEGQWAGRRVFVVGGGPSFDPACAAALAGETVVAVNSAWTGAVAEVADLVVTGDVRWLTWHGPRVPARLPLLYCRRKLYKYRNAREIARAVYVANCTEDKTAWARTFAGGVVPGDSGLRAVHLASILGADVVYLLGFDMGAKGHQPEHWHGGYNWRSDLRRYARFCDFWRALWAAGHVHTRVVNLNPRSPLSAFVETAKADTVLARVA